MELPQRQAHAVSDWASRALKAKKIAQLLKLTYTKIPVKLLEVGCGSGGISHYFAHHLSLNCNVYAVDIYDNRQKTDGYQFVQVHDTALPFSDHYFDIIITNHVIEHVGGTKEQLHHLTEIRRVLKPYGQCYLAVPNRWMLTEPHYKLKFLSWLPHSWRTSYLKLMKKGEFYDCEPLELSQLEDMLSQTGFQFQNLSIEATKATFNIEKPNSFFTIILNRLPAIILKPFLSIIPTLIYKIF